MKYKLSQLDLKNILKEQNNQRLMEINPSENLINPYPAIFNSIAASKTDPAVGA